MKRIILLVSFAGLLLAACSPEYVPTPPTLAAANSPAAADTHIPLPTNLPPQTGLPLTTPPPAGLNPAQQAAVTSLAATLNLSADQIKVLSTQAVIWPDGCLGVQRSGTVCTTQQVPGFVIMLQANGRQYELNTNRDGSEVIPSGGIQASGPAQEAVKKYLASALGMDASQITVLSDTAVEWPDSCLGVAQAGIMCAMVVMPGHLILLRTDTSEYAFHTNEDGSEIRPASLALTWQRNGGLAGFCDSLTVYLSGEVSASNCKAGERTGRLSAPELTQLEQWLMQLHQADLDASDPAGVTDRMTRRLVLFGNGDAQPSEAEQQALLSWAQDLYQRLYK